MADFVKKTVDVQETATKRFRIVLTSRNVPALESVSDELKRAANNISAKFSGPVRLPTKILRISTRKTPCGEGSKTWDRFELRIHKRIIDITSSTDGIKELTKIVIAPGVHIDVIVQ